MRNIIEIEKDLLPYNFDIVLAGEEFNMAFMYNKTADLFTCTLSKNKEVLVYNEPVIYGVEMFADVYKSGVFPMISIVTLDEGGIETAVTYDNFGKTVFLTIDDEPDSEV
ncbi:phage baseplate plug protein [Phascolarctobacterium sp.]|uniref:phage baseplate plug family protein n=1 Tax=Phascolarctobacterium sp. TaxID=2049039 RepID=UPI00386F8EBE